MAYIYKISLPIAQMEVINDNDVFNCKENGMWCGVKKIVSALFKQCVLEMIIKLSTSNLLKMYSYNVKKNLCTLNKSKHILNWRKNNVIQAVDFPYEWLLCRVINFCWILAERFYLSKRTILATFESKFWLYFIQVVLKGINYEIFNRSWGLWRK